jgi:hypothetical protein
LEDHEVGIYLYSYRKSPFLKGKPSINEPFSIYIYTGYPTLIYLVGGFNHLEKYESQWDELADILWKIKNVRNHQPDFG